MADESTNEKGWRSARSPTIGCSLPQPAFPRPVRGAQGPRRLQQKSWGLLGWLRALTHDASRVFASPPIQYQASIWRRLAKHKDLGLLVHYFSDMSIRGGIDPGFGVPVAWDQPLLRDTTHVPFAHAGP